LLKGVPLASSPIEAELTTPTGAAIVASLADDFGALPTIAIEQIGCGAGDKDFEQQANILRLIVGQDAGISRTDQVWVLETNLDDISGEVIAYCAEQLLAAGALDVFTAAIQMKKNRPGTLLTVLCEPPRRLELEALLFRETGTLGIRRYLADRTTLHRESRTVETPWGVVDGKLATLPDGQRRFTPEYEACRAVARRNNVSVREVFQIAQAAWHDGA
jgi:uncharacterized protein (DUF111 family)